MKRAALISTLIACAGAPALAQSLDATDASTTTLRGNSGPDVIFQTVTDIDSFGPVGTKRAYIGDSYTCNIGDVPLLFGFGANGSPVLVFNMYRLMDGRIEQIGQSWAKHACCAIQGSGCGLPCTGAGGLGSGCRDIYSAGWNASQGNLGPRSAINAYTGEIPGISGVGGSTIAGRLQVETDDLGQEGAGATYLFEGVYVGSDDAPAGNAYNNATYRQVSINELNFSMSPTGTTFEGVPAIQAWQEADPSVTYTTADVPGEGRFHVAAKASDNGDGTHRYEYAIFNLTSHRSGGSFSVPLPAGASVSGAGFKDVDYHSGEPYDNTDWTISTDGGSVTWSSPETFAQNENSNALRWGTMYNFWFDSSAAPQVGATTLGLFRPGSPASIGVDLPVPGTAGCNEADLAEPFGSLDFSDVSAFLVAFSTSDPSADLAVPFGSFDFSDVAAFLSTFGAGCP